MNIKDFKWTEKRFGTTFANILKKLGGLSKDATDGSIEYKDEQGNVTKLVTDSNFSSLLAKNGLVEVKWQELKDKRDNGELIPGSLYRITDYQCTTTQENTQSAGHQFDIVLLALSENKLAEEGWAMEHTTDVYDVTFSDEVTKKCYIYYCSDDAYNIVAVDSKLGMEGIDPAQIVFDENNKTAVATVPSTMLDKESLQYSYFQNSNLSAWKVWYCLDNDKSRFAWADDGETESIDIYGDVYSRNSQGDADGYYAWEKEGVTNYYFTKSPTPKVGDMTYLSDGNGNYEEDDPITAISGFGRGVIYRLIDEWNNDVGYDFKNIQYKTKLDSDGFYNINGDDSWTYSLNCYDVDNSICYDASIICATLVVSDMTLDCNNNFISCSIGGRKFALRYNQIFMNYSFGDEITNSACFVKMFDSKNVRIGFGNYISTYNCSSMEAKYEGNAIYLSNKKVLTEE